jgi:hypothetical protein
MTLIRRLRDWPALDVWNPDVRAAQDQLRLPPRRPVCRELQGRRAGAGGLGRGGSPATVPDRDRFVTAASYEATWLARSSVRSGPAQSGRSSRPSAPSPSNNWQERPPTRSTLDSSWPSTARSRRNAYLPPRRRRCGRRACRLARQRPFQQVLAETEWVKKLTDEDRRGLTALFWSNVNPYGTTRARTPSDASARV